MSVVDCGYRSVWHARRHETPLVEQRGLPDAAHAGGELVRSDVFLCTRSAAGDGYVTGVARLARVLQPRAVDVRGWHRVQHGAVAAGQRLHDAAAAAHSAAAVHALTDATHDA